MEACERGGGGGCVLRFEGGGRESVVSDAPLNASNVSVGIASGSPPESTPYVLSGKSACCVVRPMSESGLEYTPFISLYTTPLYASGGAAASSLAHAAASAPSPPAAAAGSAGS